MKKAIDIQGSIEFETCFFLEYSPNIISFEAQPDEFYYEFNGKSCRYTPDFLVEDKFQGQFYIENKFSQRTINENFRQRFKVKQAKAVELGVPIKLVTEIQVESFPVLNNLKLLHRYSNLNEVSPLCQNLIDLVDEAGKLTVSNLCELVSSPKGDVMSHTLALISKGYLNTDLFSHELGIDSEVWINRQNRKDPLPSDLGNFFDEFEVSASYVKDDSHAKDKDLIARDLDTFPESVKQEVMFRHKLINWLQSRLTAGWTEKNLSSLLAQAASELNIEVPKWRTVAQWWSDYKNSNYSMLALVPKHEKKGRRIKVTNEKENEIFQMAVAKYLDAKKPSITAVFEFYEDRIDIEASKNPDSTLKALSYKGFYNRIKKLPADEDMAARHGKLKAQREFSAVGVLVPPKRVLERVEIDHTPLDLILLDDELGFPLGRAYLTVLIDVFSHCVVGAYFGFKEPSYYAVQKALLNAVKPKGHIREKFPCIENDWPCYGDIETLVVDNGAEFWSRNIELACSAAGFNIDYNKVKNPWLKPIIERFFGTLNTKLLSIIPGKTFSNILEKEDYDPAKDAVMRFSTFNEVFHKWIVDSYHMDTDKRRSRLPPYYLWQKSVECLPPLPVDNKRIEDLEVSLGYSDYRSHGKGGIKIHSLRYDSEQLASFRKFHTTKINGKLKNKELLVKTNPDDISSIRVYIEKIKSYIEVPCQEAFGYTIGLSLQRHQILRALYTQYVEEKISKKGLARFRIYLHDRIEEEIEQTYRIAKKGTVKSAARLAKQSGIASDAGGTVIPEPLPEKLVESVKISPQIADLADDEWDDFISSLEPYE